MNFNQYGFQIPNGNVIMYYLGGSAAHGAKIEGKADTDWYGVYVEPMVNVLGLTDKPHFTYTSGNGTGNTAQDMDICLYSLRKWAGLAAKGNPSCLHFLFAPKEYADGYWEMIQLEADKFVSKDSMSPFLGFADAQLKRLFGEKGQKNVNRTELEEKFGYDTKYAMHVVRLFGEAKELMETGKITLPRPEKELLIDIRKGCYTLSNIREMAEQLEREALDARDRSPLRESVNRDEISELITNVQHSFWTFEEIL